MGISFEEQEENEYEGLESPKGLTKTCKGCRHYCPYVYEFDEGVVDDWLNADMGECRRFPPKIVPYEESGFPIVREDCWCGEFDI